MKNIRSFLGAAGVAAVAALGMSTAALADDDGANKFGYSITISGTSDYMFRGISFTNEDPAFQPFIEFTYGNPNLTWYLDFWGSNIADPFGPFELDIYAGVRPVTGPVSWDFGILYYTYPNNSIGSPKACALGYCADNEGDYIELKAAASITPFTNFTTGATFYYTPDQGNNYGETWTIEGNAAYTLPNFYMFTPVVSGVVGYTSGIGDSSPGLGQHDYTYWNAGLKLSVDKYFMDFRYWDTSIGKNAADGFDNDLADSRFVFTAGVNLP
ncbi:TorF family putative porin [Hyphomicrobium sp. DY-1]|uniref:TorF family putative porin n=1 Tax=Hyphomicrobium sp. DY-1 TaxID=3075650 RepID=UPI0039C368E3